MDNQTALPFDRPEFRELGESIKRLVSDLSSTILESHRTIGIADDLRHSLGVEKATESLRTLQLVDQLNESVSGFIEPARSLLDGLKFQSPLTAWQTIVTGAFDSIIADSQLWQKQLERSREFRNLIWRELPKRGWYLTGEEPHELSIELGELIKAGNWQAVDERLLQHLPEFRIAPLQEWLVQKSVPQHCINRILLFLSHHQHGRYEEATYLGIPLLDELARHLYQDVAFTTKRKGRSTKGSDQSKPELGFQRTSGPKLEEYASGFLQSFGSVHEDIDPRRLADADYWNRHAILHGQMQRPMGVKDSAKCLMAFAFLVCLVREDEPATDSMEAPPTD